MTFNILKHTIQGRNKQLYRMAQNVSLRMSVHP